MGNVADILSYHHHQKYKKAYITIKDAYNYIVHNHKKVPVVYEHCLPILPLQLFRLQDTVVGSGDHYSPHYDEQNDSNLIVIRTETHHYSPK